MIYKYIKYNKYKQNYKNNKIFLKIFKMIQFNIKIMKLNIKMKYKIKIMIQLI